MEHNHTVYVQRPPVYRLYHGYPQQNTPGEESNGHYNRQGSYDYNGTSHEGYNHQKNPQRGQNNRQGHAGYSNTRQRETTIISKTSLRDDIMARTTIVIDPMATG
jgi:hypothetical protein